MLGEVHTTHRWTALAIVVAFASQRPAPALAEAPPWEREAAQSDDVARAEAHAAEAFSAYGRKDYTGAISLYMKALAASPSADILFNVARIYDTKLGDRELASRFYRRYIADPGAEPDRVRMANERLLVLRQLDKAAEQRPEAAPAQPAPAPAAETSEASAPRKPYPRRPERERGMSGLEIAGVVVGALGLSGLGVGAGFGLAAKAEGDKAKEDCDGRRCTTLRALEELEDARESAKIATISLIAGGALVAVGTTLLVWGVKQRRGRHEDTASFHVTPFATANTLGTQLISRW